MGFEMGEKECYRALNDDGDGNIIELVKKLVERGRGGE